MSNRIQNPLVEFDGRSPKTLIAVICFSAMIGCVLVESGLLVLSALGPQPRLIALLYWALLPFLVATLIYLKHPVPALVTSWFVFLLSAVIDLKYTNNERSAVWFLYQHSLEIGYIALSHVGYFVALKKRGFSLKPNERAFTV